MPRTTMPTYVRVLLNTVSNTRQRDELSAIGLLAVAHGSPQTVHFATDIIQRLVH